jgi:O-antigen/teichoic acid export membrane protein
MSPNSSNSNVLRIAQNTISLLSEGLIGRVTSFIFTLVVVRHLSAADFGLYSTLVSFVTLGIGLAEFGISYVLIREIAQQKGRSTELFSGAIVISLPFFVIFAVGTVSVAILFGYERSFVLLLALGTLGGLGNMLVLLAGAVFRAFERMVVLSVVNSVILIFATAAGILWVWHGATVRDLILLFVGTPVVNALILMGYVSRYFAKISVREGMRSWKILVLNAAPLAVYNLCALILLRFNVIWLSNTRGMAETGIFCAARNVTDTLSLVILSVVAAVFPFMAVQWKESTLSAVKHYERTLRFFILFGMGVTVGVFFLSEKIIPFLYSDRYLESASCLKILIWGFMFNALGGPVGMLLVVTKERLRQYIPYALAVTSISVTMNVWWIPTYGYYAASYVEVLSSFLLFAVKMVALGDILPARPQWFKLTWRPIMAGALMGGVLWRMRFYSLMESMVTGFIVYAVCLGLLGEFAGEYHRAIGYLKRLKT